MKSRVIVAGSLVLIVTMACSPQDTEATPGSTTQGGSSSSTPSAPSSESSEPLGPSEPATPEVVPATGEQVTVVNLGVDVLRFRLPEGPWELSSGDQTADLDNAQGSFSISGDSFSVAPSKGLPFYLRSALSFYDGVDVRPERVANRVVDGIEGYVLEGSNKLGYAYEFGAPSGDGFTDSFVKLRVTATRDSPQVRGWVESVLASVEWL